MKMVMIMLASLGLALARAQDQGNIQANGSKWIWSGTGKAFISNYVMLGPNNGPLLNEWDDTGFEAFLVEMVGGHGFTGVHIPVFGQWFEIGRQAVPAGASTIDSRTLDVLEMMIRKTYSHGGGVHIWMWGDAQRSQNPPGAKSEALDRMEKLVCDSIYSRLNPLPGWTLGYGYDLWEWTTEGHLKAWHDYMHAKPGWSHLLGARSYKNQISQIYDGLDYSSYENHKPDYATYRQMAEKYPGKPSFSEDRFRVRGREKDVTPEQSRQMLWRAATAGGVAGIWGYLGSEAGESRSYPNKELILCYNIFWHQKGRFLVDLVVDNSITDGYGLRAGSTHYVFLKENSSTITFTLEGEPKKVVVVDARKPYEEIPLEIKPAGEHQLTLPSVSDRAVAFGDFPGETAAGISQANSMGWKRTGRSHAGIGRPEAAYDAIGRKFSHFRTEHRPIQDGPALKWHRPPHKYAGCTRRRVTKS